MKTSGLTIARGMALVGLASVISLVARWWLPASTPPPPGDSAFYESAPASDDLAIRVGPNRFEVASVVRNDRDGSIRAEDGRGNPAGPASTAETADLASSAPWLDAANINLGGDPSRIEVHEIRVFDHATRTLLGKPGSNMGGSLVGPGVLQVRSLGADLPDRIDVWLKASSHGASEPIHPLPAKVGASARLGDGAWSLSVAEIRPGLKMGRHRVMIEPSPWDISKFRFGDHGMGMTGMPIVASKSEAEVRAFVEANTRSDFIIDWAGAALCSVLFRRDGDDADGRRFQVVAVARDGRRCDPVSSEQSFTFRETEQFLTFPLDAEEIDRFDIRPAGAQHAFYFDSVVLPAARGKRYLPPPTAEIKIGGHPGRYILTGFAPLRVNLRIHPGRDDLPVRIGNSISPTRGVLRFDASETRDMTFLAMIEVDGIASRDWSAIAFDPDGAGTSLGTNLTRVTAGEISHYRATWSGSIPVDRLRRIRVEPPR